MAKKIVTVRNVHHTAVTTDLERIPAGRYGRASASVAKEMIKSGLCEAGAPELPLEEPGFGDDVYDPEDHPLDDADPVEATE